MQVHRGKRVGLSSASSEFQEKMSWVKSAASDLPSGLTEGFMSLAGFPPR
jgi:hypothetical protein